MLSPVLRLIALAVLCGSWFGPGTIGAEAKVLVDHRTAAGQAKMSFEPKIAEPYTQTSKGFTHSIGSSQRYRPKSNRLIPTHLRSPTSPYIVSPSKLRTAKSFKAKGQGQGRKGSSLGYLDVGNVGAGIEVCWMGVGRDVPAEYQGSAELWDETTDEPVYLSTLIEFTPAIPLGPSPSVKQSSPSTVPAFLSPYGVENPASPFSLGSIVKHLRAIIFPFSVTYTVTSSTSGLHNAHSASSHGSTGIQPKFDLTGDIARAGSGIGRAVPRTVEELEQAGWSRASEPVALKRTGRARKQKASLGRKISDTRVNGAGKVEKSVGRGRRAGTSLEFKRARVQL